ncbi:fatty acid synthase S-acetyltransferase [Truncatella angustata]|uniref:Fatty acid synthase S-acetyltransferase n=1 Tax=Truncatella angustata TaxID=152316 RepID=A0A9P8RHS2_9PEZI|nr:fatty acid synthase S-acetyltransferase [Truncatella angustata]KAH6646092.1 fatty acid synthase S-acetyltransferase [Truncatella angustata]
MEPIAIVGLSFKLPGDVTDEGALWQMLVDRRNAMTEWPANRIAIDAFFDKTSEARNRLQSRGGHFVSDDPASFDAPFFSITAKDAASMDPQQRWALECSFHAFENAGMPVESLKGSRMAVFGSSMSDDYSRMLSRDPDTFPRTAITGIQSAMLSNRVSWYYGLTGPSMTVDTACSSAMVSLDLACQSLRSREATSALVFGSNWMLAPDNSLMLANMGFTSPDSVCWSFDSRANGYGRGEGVIALVLKPLSAAIEDGDMIRAVIRSSGSNQDGHTPGLTQPSLDAQESLIRHVYEKANLDYDSTRYVEAHGTGTPVGDPIEMEAIGKVFRKFRSTEEPLYVGSIKSNIGHLEAGSGLAGILKAIMILEKGVIPPNALFENINPKIDTAFLRTQVPTGSISWPACGLRRVSVNSFGFGGTNAHVVLDSASHYLRSQGLVGHHRCTTLSTDLGVPHVLEDSSQAPVTTYDDSVFKTNPVVDDYRENLAHDQLNGITNGSTHILRNGTTNGGVTDFSDEITVNGKLPDYPRLLVWTASSEKTLVRLTSDYDAYYRAKIHADEEKLEQLAHTLASRRSCMKWRSFAVVHAGSGAQADIGLSVEKPLQTSTQPRTSVFVFTGQGAQYAGMGLELLVYRTFRDHLQKAEDIFASLGCTWSILDKIKDPDAMNNPEYSQPLCTAIQIALVELLRSFNITPKAVVGHSSGEIAAAYTAGALSIQSACKVAYLRGLVTAQAQVIHQSSPGAMLSVNITEDELPTYLRNSNSEDLGDKISIACVNSPSNCTLAATEAVIDRLKMQLEDDQIFAQKLNTGVAYHSPMMEEVASQYLNLLGTLDSPDTTKGGILMISSVTGCDVTPKVLTTAEYWVANLTSQVKFSPAVTALIQTVLNSGQKSEPHIDLIEIGPHAALRRPIRDITSQDSLREKVFWYGSVLDRSTPSHKAALVLLGRLFCRGYPVSLAEVNMSEVQVSERKARLLTDCPKYPFDHSHTFWSESRFSRDFRNQRDTFSYVLGYRSHDWNPLEPTWRNYLSTESMSWLGDHVVSGKTIFPGSGMLVMAMEAARETSSPGRSIRGFYFKEAQFLNSIPIGATVEEATETVTRLRPVKQMYEKEASWVEISIFAVHDGRWDECFTAKIQVQYHESATQVDGGKERRLGDQWVVDSYKRITGSCKSVIKPQVFYDFCQDLGITYGESFQLLNSITYTADEAAAAKITVAKSPHQGPGLVHPAILDASHHLLMAQMSKRRIETIPTLVPRQFNNTWISAAGWGPSETSQIRLVSISKCGKGKMPTESILYGLGDDDSILCKMEHMIMAPVSRNKMASPRSSGLLHSIEWKPQLSLLEPQQLQEICNARSIVSAESQADMINKYVNLDKAMTTAMYHALSRVTDADLQHAPAHIRQYAAMVGSHLRGDFLPPNGDTKIEVYLEDMLQTSEKELPEMEMTSIVARNLDGILRGHVNPLELIFSTDCAERLYRDLFRLVLDERFCKFLELATHETPELRILEVGAGTGGVTEHVLSAIRDFETQTGASLFAEYVYTDISAGFFDNARAKFQDFEERMVFKTFDLQRDASKQGFKHSSFDIVIAGSVLHATADLKSTLRGIRSLLKSGGRLVNLEMVMPDSACSNVTFGVLPGWWLSTEEWRATGPLITEEKWDEITKETGFSGNDMIIRDFDSAVWHLASLIVTTAVDPSGQPSQLPQLNLVIDPLSDDQLVLATELRIHTNTKTLCLRELGEAGLSRDDIIVCLLELDKPFLATISEQDFGTLQSLLRQTQKLLWITSSAITDESYAFDGLSTGFLRSIRSEEGEKYIATLNIESTSQIAPEACSGYIRKVLDSVFVKLSKERDFVVRDGFLSAGRAVEEVALNERHISLLEPKWERQSWLPGPPLALEVGTPGALDSLQLVEDRSYQNPLRPDEIEIEAKAWAISFRDTFIALGRLPAGEELGFECTGIVTRVGDQGSPDFQPGDRVCLAAFGSMRTYPRGKIDFVFKIPDGISFESAVSTINPGATAYHTLINLARLQKGERILIHSAAGSTGQMALYIAKMIGAEIFATVGFDDKKELLINEFDIPADHIFYSRNTSFAQGILRLTDGRGVDVVLNSLSGDGLRASWECVAPYGRFVEIGKSDIMSNSSLPMAGFAKNVSFFAMDLYHIAITKPELGRSLILSLMELLAEKRIDYPKPLHIYPVSRIEESFRLIQSGKNTGRVVITIDQAEVVSKLIRHQDRCEFNHEATYLVVGGLGGLGRAIVRWMARQGAKNMILPSRTGPVSQAAIQVVLDLKARGINVVTPICDASSFSSLSAVLEDCAKSMPPVKGCINGSMVLQDAVFQNMTHAQWELTIKSKVQVSWNLHRLLPNMDFFILLASLSGVYGSVAQSNYAAGCTFQDALARFRVARGENTVALDLGWMRSIGIVAETEKFQEYRQGVRNMIPLEEEELLALLELCCDSSTRRSPMRSQVMMGAKTPAYYAARGETPDSTVFSPLFSTFARVSDKMLQGGLPTKASDPAVLFRHASDLQERAEIFTNALIAKLARSLSMPSTEVEATKQLSDYGVDSLMAVELRNWISKDFKVQIAVFDIMGGTTLAAIGDLVATRTEI